MPVMYKLRQDNRECSNFKGYWFAHTVNLGTIDTEDLAEIIQRNCSLKKSDVVAVMIELTELVQQKLLDFHRVRIGGLGSLMVGIHGRGAPTPQDFSPSENIHGLHLIFIPEADFLADGEVVEMPKYDKPY